MTNEEIKKNAPAKYFNLELHDFWLLEDDLLDEWLRRPEEAVLRRLDIAESSLHRELSKDEQLSVFGMTFWANVFSPPLLAEYIPTQFL